MRRTLMTALTAMATASTAALGQEQSNMQRPTNFRIRYDRANAVDSLFYFVTMRPGWHVTSGRAAAVLWNPETAGRGNYRVESLIHVFPLAGGHAEGFGLVLGGRELDGANQDYLYFLIRKDGQFLIKHRAGAATHDVVAWTANPAIVPQPAEDTTAQSVRNTLAVEVGARDVEFFVNGQRVHTMPRAAANFDGIVGLRVNHGVNLHVQSLTVTQR